MSKILDNLYLGGVRESKSLEFLKSKNITHIVNVAEELDAVFPKIFKYLTLKINDYNSSKYHTQFDQIADFIDSAINKENGAVFVHCFRGVNRSATAVISYLMKYHQMTCDEAKKFTQDKRPCISPRPINLGQLQRYELDLKQRGTKDLITDLMTKPALSSIKEEEKEVAESTNLQNKIKKDPNEQNLIVINTPKYKASVFNFDYKCLKCDTLLFKEEDAIDHLAHSYISEGKCESLYLNQLFWLDDRKTNDKIINCPNSKCKTELGQINLARSKCSCGLEVEFRYQMRRNQIKLDDWTEKKSN